jgi:hypothetical protein
MLLVSLAGCGGETAPTEAPQATEAPQVTTPAPTDSVETEAAPTQGEDIEETYVEETARSYTTEAQELVNNENVTFTITGFQENAHLGLEMQIHCENKSDKDMMFSLNNVSVCGVMFDPFWAEEVAAGKQVNSTVYFDTYALEDMGIDWLDEISFRLSVIDNVNWMDDPFVDEAFTVYPTGLDAASIKYPQYQHKHGETVVVDNESLLFIIEKVDDAEGDTYTLYAFLENRTDKELLVSWDGVSVNKAMVDPFWAAGIGPGKQLYTQISFFRSDLEAQGIDNVSHIAFTLAATDYGTYETVFEEACSFQPK